jgi:hypothetical protein
MAKKVIKTLEDAIDKLSQNFGTKLQIYAAKNRSKTQIPLPKCILLAEPSGESK